MRRQREYIDCVGGPGRGQPRPLRTRHGRGHRASRPARLITCPEIFYNDRRAELLARLAAIAPAGAGPGFPVQLRHRSRRGRAQVCAAGSTGRRGVVAAQRGFHGRTMGALSATWKDEYRRPSSRSCRLQHVPFNDLTRSERP
jgi:LysW-gamma-L-lysine/LysW-L-ornithine aminotransferase